MSTKPITAELLKAKAEEYLRAVFGEVPVPTVKVEWVSEVSNVASLTLEVGGYTLQQDDEDPGIWITSRPVLIPSNDRESPDVWDIEELMHSRDIHLSLEAITNFIATDRSAAYLDANDEAEEVESIVDGWNPTITDEDEPD